MEHFDDSSPFNGEYSIQQKLYQLLYANLCEWMVHGEKYDPFGELFFDMVPTTVATTDDIPLKPSMDILLQDNGDPTTTKIDPRKWYGYLCKRLM